MMPPEAGAYGFENVCVSRIKPNRYFTIFAINIVQPQ
jgi:hypothetical protein